MNFLHFKTSGKRDISLLLMAMTLSYLWCVHQIPEGTHLLSITRLQRKLRFDFSVSPTEHLEALNNYLLNKHKHSCGFGEKGKSSIQHRVISIPGIRRR